MGNGPSLVQLTENGESALEVHGKLDQFRAVVVVTAGRNKLTRRGEGQPFISLAVDRVTEQPQHEQGEQEEQKEQNEVEVAQHRELELQQQERPQEHEQEHEVRRRQTLVNSPAVNSAQVGQAVTLVSYDSSLAALAGVVDLMNSVAVGLERVLGRRLFPITISLYDRTACGTVPSGPYAIFDASAGALLIDRQFLSYTWGDDQPQVTYIAGQLASRVFSSMTDILAAPAAAAAGGAGAAATAASVTAAALAAALPAAFTAAPPLWFCILCPSVLGLLAPVVINLALNQVAGALCAQLHLTDDVCFDLLLGALGAGFVLSLASAVPIFFVCRLPECAGRNVTAALRQLGLPIPGGGAVAAAGAVVLAAAGGGGGAADAMLR